MAANKKLGVQLQGDASGFNSAIMGAQSRLGTFKKMALGATAAIGAGTVVMGANAVGAAKEYQKAMADVKAASGTGEEGMEILRAKARELGRSSKFMMTDIAAAEKVVAKMGLSATQVRDSMDGIVNAASASDEPLKETAERIMGVTRGFDLAAGQTSRVADVLANAAMNSGASIKSLAGGFQEFGPIAESAGWTLEETAAILGKLSDRQIESTKAGRMLRTSLLDFQKMSGETFSKNEIKRLEEMGVNMDDLSGLTSKAEARIKKLAMNHEELSLEKLQAGKYEFREFVTLLKEAGATSGDFSAIFNKRASTVLEIIGQNSNAIDGFTQKLLDSKGAAREMAKTQLDSLEGQLTILRGSWNALNIAIGQKFLPTLESFTRNGLIPFTNNMIGVIRKSDSFGEFIQNASNQWLPGFGDALDYIQNRGLLSWIQNVTPSMSEISDRADEIWDSIQDWGSRKISWAVDLAKGDMGEVSDWIEKRTPWTVNLTKGALGAVGDWIGKGVIWTAGLQKGDAEAVQGWIDKKVDWTASLVKGSMEAVSDWLDNPSVSWGVTLYKKSKKKVSDWIGRTEKWSISIAEDIDKWIKNNWSSFKNWINEIKKWKGKSIGWIVKVDDDIDQYIKNNWATVEKIAGRVEQWGSKRIEWGVKFTSDVRSWGTKKLSNVIDFFWSNRSLKPDKELEASIEFINKVGKGITGNVQNVINWFWPAKKVREESKNFQATLGFIDKVKGWANGRVKAVKSFFWGKDYSDIKLSGTLEFISDLGKWAADKVQGFRNWFWGTGTGDSKASARLSFSTNLTKSFLDNVWPKIKDLWDTTKNRADKSIEWTVDLVKGKNKAKKWADKITDKIWNWSVNLVKGDNKAGKWARKQTDEAVSWAVDLVSGSMQDVIDWAHAGKDISWPVDLRKGSDSAVAVWTGKTLEWTVDLVQGTVKFSEETIKNAIGISGRIKKEVPFTAAMQTTVDWGKGLKNAITSDEPFKNLIKQGVKSPVKMTITGIAGGTAIWKAATSLGAVAAGIPGGMITVTGVGAALAINQIEPDFVTDVSEAVKSSRPVKNLVEVGIESPVAMTISSIAGGAVTWKAATTLGAVAAGIPGGKIAVTGVLATLAVGKILDVTFGISQEEIEKRVQEKWKKTNPDKPAATIPVKTKIVVGKEGMKLDIREKGTIEKLKDIPNRISQLMGEVDWSGVTGAIEKGWAEAMKQFSYSWPSIKLKDLSGWMQNVKSQIIEFFTLSSSDADPGTGGTQDNSRTGTTSTGVNVASEQKHFVDILRNMKNTGQVGFGKRSDKLIRALNGLNSTLQKQTDYKSLVPSGLKESANIMEFLFPKLKGKIEPIKKTESHYDLRVLEGANIETAERRNIEQLAEEITRLVEDWRESGGG